MMLIMLTETDWEGMANVVGVAGACVFLCIMAWAMWK